MERKWTPILFLNVSDEEVATLRRGGSIEFNIPLAHEPKKEHGVVCVGSDISVNAHIARINGVFGRDAQCIIKTGRVFSSFAEDSSEDEQQPST